MKPSSLLLSIALLVAAFTLAASAQTPQEQPATVPADAVPHHDHNHPAPTNLKVLPKSMTGEQVHALMEQWEGALGVHCNTCHTADPTNIGPNGRPRLNFADDSKPEKATARTMYTMMEEINRNYISKIDNTGAQVTCGTCHRGHLGPEPFVLPKEDEKPPAQSMQKPVQGH